MTLQSDMSSCSKCCLNSLVRCRTVGNGQSLDPEGRQLAPRDWCFSLFAQVITLKMARRIGPGWDHCCGEEREATLLTTFSQGLWSNGVWMYTFSILQKRSPHRHRWFNRHQQRKSGLWPGLAVSFPKTMALLGEDRLHDIIQTKEVVCFASQWEYWF